MSQDAVDSDANSSRQISEGLYELHVVRRHRKRVQLFSRDVIGDANRCNMHSVMMALVKSRSTKFRFVFSVRQSLILRML